MIIHRYGLQVTLISFPALLLLCAVVVYISPTIWVVFAVMMVMKGMSYALNNPTKEILYQVCGVFLQWLSRRLFKLCPPL